MGSRKNRPVVHVFEDGVGEGQEQARLAATAGSYSNHFAGQGRKNFVARLRPAILGFASLYREWVHTFLFTAHFFDESMRTCLSPTLYSATWSSSESIKGCSLQALMHLVLPSSSGTQRILNLEIAKARSPVTDAVSEPSRALSAPLIFFFTRFTRPARQRRPGCDSADLCRDSGHHLRP